MKPKTEYVKEKIQGRNLCDREHVEYVRKLLLLEQHIHKEMIGWLDRCVFKKRSAEEDRRPPELYMHMLGVPDLYSTLKAELPDEYNAILKEMDPAQYELNETIRKAKECFREKRTVALQWRKDEPDEELREMWLENGGVE